MYKRDIAILTERVQNYKALVTYAIQASSTPEDILDKFKHLELNEESSNGSELQIAGLLGNLGMDSGRGEYQ